VQRVAGVQIGDDDDGLYSQSVNGECLVGAALPRPFQRVAGVTVGSTPTNSVAPSVSWTGILGSSPTITPGTWSNSPTLTYTLYRNGVAVVGQTGRTAAQLNAYVAVAADLVTAGVAGGQSLKWKEIPNGVDANGVFTNTILYAAAKVTTALTATWDGDIATLTSGKVSDWPNQSAAGSFLQGTAGARPLQIADCDPTGTHDAIRTNGTTDFMGGGPALSALFSATDCYGIIATKFNGAFATDSGTPYSNVALIAEAAAYFGLFGRASTGINHYIFDTLNADKNIVAPAAADTPLIIEFWRTGGFLNLRIMNIAATPVAAAGIHATGMAGALQFGKAAASVFLAADTWMIELHNTALDAAGRLQALTYFSQRFGIAGLG
jgi:hypothetical protein